MANVVWSSGGSTDGNVAGNWNPARVPTTGDTAYFDATSVVNCTFSGNISCDGFNATAAYSGNIDFGDSKTHTWGASNFVLAHTGATDLGAGTTHNAASCDWTTANATGAWTRGTSTVTFAGTCTVNTGTTNDFYNLTVASGTTTVSTNSTEIVNTCTINGILSVNTAKTLRASGAVDIGNGGQLTGAGTATIAFLSPGAGEGVTTFHSGGTWDIPVVSIARPNIAAVLASGNYQSVVRIHNTSSVADYTFTLTAAGIYQFNSLELETTGTNALKLDNTNGPVSITIIGDLIIDEDAGGAIIIDDSGQSVDWDIRGDILDERTGDTFTWTKGTGTVDLSGTADQACDFMDQDCGQLTITKGTSGTVDIEAAACELGAVTMADDFTVTNSTLTSSADAKTIDGNVDLYDAGNDINAGAAVWSITRNFDISTVGTWTPGTAVFTASGGNAADWNLKDQIFGAIVVNKSGGTLTFSNDVAAASFTGTAGTWDPSGKTYAITGDFTTSVGFVTTNAANVMNSCTIIVGGNLSLVGQSGTLLRLLATAGWTLTVTGTATARGVEVEYSDASGGTEITANNCIDGEDNSNWNFITAINNLRIGGDIFGWEPSIQLLPDENVKILI